MPSIEQLQKALQADPNDAFLRYALALEFAKADDHERALTEFDHAIQAEPTNAYHHFHKARSLEALDRIDDAKATLQAGIQTAKSTGDAKALNELSGYLDSL